MRDESRKPLNQWGSDSNTSSNGLIGFVKRVGKIIVWPFIALVSVLTSATGFLNGVGKTVAETPAWVNNKISDLILRRQRKKAWKKLSKLLGGVMLAGSPLMHNLSMSRIVGVLTIMLQSISFCTTYGGTTYYFYDIGAWVPIFLAIVIQTTILLFSFSLDTKTRNRWPKWIVLTLAVCVSIAFSYIGIINNTIPPYEEATLAYNMTLSSANTLKEECMNNTEFAYSPIYAANIIRGEVLSALDFQNWVRNFVAAAEAEDADVGDYSNLLSGLSKETETRETDENGIEHSIITKEYSPEVIDKAIRKFSESFKYNEKKIEPAQTQLETALKQFKFGDPEAVDSAYSMSDIVEILTKNSDGGKSGEVWSFYDLHQKYVDIVNAQNYVATVINEVLSEPSQRSSDAESKTDTVTDTEAAPPVKSNSDNNKQLLKKRTAIDAVEFLNKLEEYRRLSDTHFGATEQGDGSSASNKVEQSEADANSMLTANQNSYDEETLENKTSKTVRAFQTLLEKFSDFILRINTSTEEEYKSILKEYLSDVQNMRLCFMPLDDRLEGSNNWEVIKTAYTMFENAPDSSIVAFRRLFDKETFDRAIVPLLLAILVDGGTVLISWAGRKKRYSSLYANTNRDYYEEEMDLFEQVFISAAGIESIKDADLSQKASDPNVFCDIVAKAVGIIHDYLSKFTPSPETVNLGCALKIVVDDAQKSDYCGLTSLLLTLGYLCPIDDRQLGLLRTGRLSEVNNDSAQKYYCLKFNAESYLRQCMTNTNLYIYFYLERIFHAVK